MGIRQVIPGSKWLSELLLFNLVAIAAALSGIGARYSDHLTKITIVSGIGIWTVGSFTSSWNSFSSSTIPEWISDLGYIAFYPFLFFGLARSLRPTHEQQRVNLLDSLITAVGLASILATLTLDIAISNFDVEGAAALLILFYPIADLILVATSFIIIFRSGITLRNSMIVISTLTFAITDFIFLIQSADGSYRFGSLVDIGWLIALILISESLWHPSSESGISRSSPISVTVAVAIGSGAIIATKSINPNLFPDGALIPAFITLALTFLRMTIALNQAHRLNHESEMARTDELTGLANRRAFLQELENVRQGDLLFLLDLNGFKPVNDRFGHAAGDLLLQHVAHRLSRITESGWVLARLGGDEFALLARAPRAPQECAQAISAAFSYPFHLAGIGDLPISASIGAVIADGEDDLLRRADLAMYRAKRTGIPLFFWSAELATGSNVATLNASKM
jgi:diguanylate cyclase (GGDEF)-like protein